MALVVESTSVATANNTSPISVTKPTGTTSGDLLLIIAGNAYDNQDVTCSGFTRVARERLVNSGGAYDATLDVLYKMAGESEPATYSVATAGGVSPVAMLRISGWPGNNPVFASEGYNFGANSTSFSVGESGLSVARPEASLMLQAILLHTNATAAGQTFASASYSITSGGSNPSWTEVIESVATILSSTEGLAMAVAYANDANTSNVTAYSASITRTGNDSADVGVALFLVITEPFNGDGTINPINATITAQAITHSNVATTAELGTPMQSTATMADGAVIENPTVWTATAKGSTTWTAQDKI